MQLLQQQARYLADRLLSVAQRSDQQAQNAEPAN